jgi:hypothetical protein
VPTELGALTVPWGGVGWAGARCPELLPSFERALFLPGGNNFLLPRLRAQELRGAVQGRSFALSSTTTLLAPGLGTTRLQGLDSDYNAKELQRISPRLHWIT